MALPTVTRVSLSSPLNTTCRHQKCTQTLQTRTQPQGLASLFTQDFQTLTTSPVFKQIFPEFYSQRTGRLKAEVTVDEISITVSKKGTKRRVTLLDISHQAQQSPSLPQFTRTHAEMVRKIHELYACHCSDASCTAPHSPQQPLTGRATPYPSPIPSQYAPLRSYNHQHTATQSDTSGDESTPRAFRPFHRSPSPTRREDELTCQLGQVGQQLADMQEELRATRFELQRAQEETALLDQHAAETIRSDQHLQELLRARGTLEGERDQLVGQVEALTEEVRHLTQTLADERRDQLQRLPITIVPREIQSTQESVDETVARLEHTLRQLEEHRTHLLQEVRTLRTELQTTQNSADEKEQAHVAEPADLHETHAAEKVQWQETADNLQRLMESAFASAALWETTRRQETERANQATREQASLLLELSKLKEDNARKTAALEGSRAETAALETHLREASPLVTREIRVREAAQVALEQEKELRKSLEERVEELRPLAERTALVSEELRESRETAQELERELGEARAALQNSTDANAQLSSQASAAQERVSQLESILANKEEDVRFLENKLQILLKNLTIWQTHDADETERANSYAREIVELQRRLIAAEQACFFQRAALLAARKELAASAEKTSHLNRELEELRETHETAERKISTLEESLELQRQVQNIADERISLLEQHLETTRADNHLKSRELITLQEQELQTQDLSRRFAESKRRCARLEEEKQEKTKRIQRLKERITRLTEEKELNAFHKAELQQAHAAIHEANERTLHDQRLEIERLVQELARLREDLDDLLALNADEKLEFATKSKEIELAKREIQGSVLFLRKELETIQTQLAEKEREVAVCTRDSEKQSSDVATETDLHDELKEALAAKTALEEHLFAMDSQLRQADRDLKELQQVLPQLSQTYKRDTKALQERVSDLTAMLDEERSALEAMTHVAHQIADAASTFKPPVIEGDGLTTILTLIPESPRDTVILDVQENGTQTDELLTAPAETEMEEDQASSLSDSAPLPPLPESPPNTPRVEVPPLRLQEVQLVTARRVTAAEEVTAIQALHVVVERLGGLEIFVEGNLKHIFEVNSQLLRTNPNQIKRTQDQTATLTIWPAGEETEPVYVVRKPEGVRKLPPIREATSRGKVGAPETCRVVEFSEDAQRNQVNLLQLQLQGLAKEVQKYSPETIDSYLPNVTRNCDLFTEACRTLTPKIEAFEGKVTTFQREWGVGETKGVMQALKTGAAPANTNGGQEAFNQAFRTLLKDYRDLQTETTRLIQSLAGMPGKHIQCMFLVNPTGAYLKEREFQRQFNALFELIRVEEKREPARSNGTAALPESARGKERDPIDLGRKTAAPGHPTAARVTARTNRSTVGTGRR